MAFLAFAHDMAGRIGGDWNETADRLIATALIVFVALPSAIAVLAFVGGLPS